MYSYFMGSIDNSFLQNGCKVIKLILYMQISIPYIRHSNDLYYISVNLSHIQKTASARLTCKSYFVYCVFYYSIQPVPFFSLFLF